jgi:L-alanine-DL-glutamate epimerase-like enolase superfamily enzyme
VVRTEIPIYLSSLRRDTTPEREVAWIAPRIEETGARAVKIKVGGRMSGNADASPGRTERLISLARETFGPDVALMADANGSYDAAKGIEIGRRLEGAGFAFFEEPCPFEELEQTKAVADALDMTVAGGEQDASLPRFSRMARDRVIDLLQPDICYVGGLTRALRVARIAAEAGLRITPHSPNTGAGAAPMLQFASVAPNIGPHQEYRGEAVRPESWHNTTFEITRGTVAVPKGPGLGLDIDPTVFEKAQIIRP